MFVESPHSICRFAIARADITPPVGIYHRMWGAATHDRSEGVHRPLTASVMMFDAISAQHSQSQAQVLAVLDHCLLGPDEIELLISAIEKTDGIDRSQVVITFSHTHAAGLMLLDRQTLPGGELIPAYLDQLSSTVASLVENCRTGLQPATIVYGCGRCSLAANRDFRDPRREQYVCGFNPELPADDTVLVARVTDEAGRVLASVVNYACHPTTLAWDNRQISPDFPGAMREVVEQATGAPCVFVQGASGDLGPREGFVGDVEVADRNGRQLGNAALAALESLPPPRTLFEYAGPVESGATIGTWEHVPLADEGIECASAFQVVRTTIPLRYRGDLPSIEQVESELRRWQADEQATNSKGDRAAARDRRAMVERQTRMLARLKSLPDGETFPYQVSAWRIGDAIWLAVQGEPYSLLQTELRERFGDVAVLVASICWHWGPAYLPPADLYGKGIYQESIAILEPGCLEQLIEQLSGMLAQLLPAAGNCEP